MNRRGDTLPVDDGSRRRGITLVLVVFILGLLCGAALSIITVRSVMPGWIGKAPFGGPPPPPPAGPGGPGGRLDILAERLELDDEQRRQLREVMQRSRREIRRVVEDSREEIRVLLNEEQREEFDRIGDRFGPDRPRRRRGGSGGAPPGRQR